MKDRDTYTIKATFSRSLSADLDVIGKTRVSAVAVKGLIQQLRKELQSAYDHPDIAPDGQFNLDSIRIDGVVYDSLTGKPK